MKDARFTILTPALLAKVVDAIDKVPMEAHNTKGDLYEICSARSLPPLDDENTTKHLLDIVKPRKRSCYSWSYFCVC